MLPTEKFHLKQNYANNVKAVKIQNNKPLIRSWKLFWCILTDKKCNYLKKFKIPDKQQTRKENPSPVLPDFLNFYNIE